MSRAPREGIFGEATVDNFSGRGVILVERQESGSTPVLMDSWNMSVKIPWGGRFERPLEPEDDFNLRDTSLDKKSFVISPID